MELVFLYKIIHFIGCGYRISDQLQRLYAESIKIYYNWTHDWKQEVEAPMDERPLMDGWS